MSFITKFSKLFAKVESPNTMGLAFRKDAIASYCLLESGETSTSQQPVEQENYLQALTDFVHQLPAAKVNLVLSASQCHIVQVDKPNIPDEELIAALKWQVKDLVPIEPDNMVLDYFSGPTLAGGAEKLNVVCSDKSELTAYVQLFEQSPSTITSITTEEFAFAGLATDHENPQLLVCQQPNEEIIILIVKAGVIYFHRRLRGYAEIGAKTPEELGFGAIDSLSLEIQRSMDYFERQLKQPPIRDIQVILPIKNEQYIASKLAENTTASVSVLAVDESTLANRAFAAAYGVVGENEVKHDS